MLATRFETPLPSRTNSTRSLTVRTTHVPSNESQTVISAVEMDSDATAAGARRVGPTNRTSQLTASDLLVGSAVAPTRTQQSNTDQQMSFRTRWSSITSSRIASGSWSRCHWHSSRPAVSSSPSGAAARAALIA